MICIKVLERCYKWKRVILRKCQKLLEESQELVVMQILFVLEDAKDLIEDLEQALR